MGLRTKIFLPVFLVCVLFSVYIIAVWMPRSRAGVEKLYLDAVKGHLESVAESLVPLILGRQLDETNGNLDALLKKNKDWEVIRLYGPGGKLLYPIDRLGEREAMSPDARKLSQNIEYLNKKLGTLEVTLDVSTHMEAIRAWSLHFLTVLLVAMLLFLVSTFFILDHWLIKPVHRLSDASRQLAHGDYDVPLPDPGKDEIGTLIKSFDRMRNAIRTHAARIAVTNEKLRREIGERKQAEEELRCERDNMISIFETMTDDIYIADAQYVIRYGNSALTRDFGPRGDRKCYEYFHHRTDPCPWCRLQSVMAGNTVRWEKHFAKTDKTFDVIETPLRISNETLKLAIFRDITERKQAEAELKKARDAADEANRLKGQFLANMSHEIRTPMNGIIGMAELLLDTPLGMEQREYVQAVRSSADALLSIINDILDFSRIEARKLIIEPVPFKLRDSLGDILQTLGLRAADKGLELAYEVSSDVPDDVIGDPGRLRQIIINLVGNAIKFTEQGEVVVSVTLEQETQEGTLFHFTVTDTGIGIPPEKQKIIFDSFTQADISTTRKYGGTGLGLAISAMLVDLMGGTIRVDSEVGRGSAFHFTVRMDVRKTPQVASPSETLGNLAGIAVLVVDDNATNRRIMEQMLKKWGLRPTLADSGPAALESAGKADKPFRLLLLDLNMPEMDGFEVAQRIRWLPGYGESAIMLLTSSGRRGDAARCRELGIAAYLTKPVKQSSLLDAILSVMSLKANGEGPAPLVTRHTLRQPLKDLHILVAEDNAINRMIAVSLLEKRGHKVAVAANGKEVLEALKSAGARSFDLILMDVQMPEMDGLEATARIRAGEMPGGRRIPIIALTAHAMEGDREDCLRAGMDGYVSKPLKADALLAEMVQVLDRRLKTAKPPQIAADGAIDRDKVFDLQEILARIEGDGKLMEEVLGLFLQESPGMMLEIKSAIDEKDSGCLAQAAHAIKGAVGNFGEGRLFDMAHGLELMGKKMEIEGAEKAFDAFSKEIDLLRKALEEIVAGGSR